MNRNFNEIYQEIYTNVINEIVELRKKKNVYLVLLSVIIIIFILQFKRLCTSFFIIVWIILLVAIGIYYLNANFKYESGYKNSVMKKLVHLYNKDLFFAPNRGITSKEYRESKFDVFFDKLHSEDLVQGKILENVRFRMSQIKVIREVVIEDSNGVKKKTKHIVFSGVFGLANLPYKIIDPIEIVPNRILKQYNPHRIEIDSSEFEKKYDIFAQNKIRAMQIFTSNLLQKINEFNEYTGYLMEIKILRGKVFFRIPCKEVFEAPEIRESLDYSTLYKYFKMIDLPIHIIQELIKNVEELEQ